MDPEILQAIRRSHCARKEETHKCVGTCKITPEGIELDCSVCGGDRELLLDSSHRLAAKRAKSVLLAAGIEWGTLAAEVQLRVIEEMRKDQCPGCDTPIPVGHDRIYYKCPCRYWIYHGGYNAAGWQKRDADTEA